MAMLPLTPEDKVYLSRLDRNTKLALKKVFINACFERPAEFNTEFLAAQRIAINMLHDIFKDIENFHLEQENKQEERINQI